ncbi:hypothetical protein ACLOJK_008888 [Asimina triloba]
MADEEVRQNKRVLFRGYITGAPKESDMLLTTSNISLKVQEGSKALLVKNLYLSCDPYQRNRMAKIDVPTYTTSYVPGEVIHSFILHSL